MNDTAILIRRASHRDAAAIRGLYGQLVSNPAVTISPEHLARLAESEHHFVLVAEQGSFVCGTALLSLCEDVMFGTQPFAVVENVIVDQQVRSHGIGSALFQEVEALCKRANCSKIMLLSSSQRVEAHQFFELQGFAGSSKLGFVKYRRNFS
ncbi:GNAT family N-acetyltransferase [Iodobacter fluviatilis]|uniref:N-acetylglutamate synthase-like GNAT family acetyltransferase n=1 Tax=Iodobacter fluviatilis TaxID=537 RepID=A0A377SUK1_9NEIS|nr:GNAT family N-acetyltransferase [Iodobacter fluviatilis]TCU85542.1 N-acetylglutamate synthase-like GNAT family acetyltransferase [Iodobacter fluviatilis]STR45010.1 putative acetyltransferase [Iodobacter fluviatilis]